MIQQSESPVTEGKRPSGLLRSLMMTLVIICIFVLSLSFILEPVPAREGGNTMKVQTTKKAKNPFIDANCNPLTLPPLDSSGRKIRLELLHIPKTGGSSVVRCLMYLL